VKESITLLEGINKRWKLANKLQQRLSAAAKFSAITTTLPEADQKALIRRVGKQGFTDRVLMSWCEHLSETPDKAQLISAAYRAMLSLADRWEVPEFPLNGADLQRAGVAPGPDLGKWLQFLEQWWEREHYRPDKDELLRYFAAQK
jgi:poly(A) polymerase